MLTTTFIGDSSELNGDFLERIKSMFKGKKVEVIITEADGMDETEYLMSSAANREHLDRAIADIRDGKNVVEVDPKLFE